MKKFTAPGRLASMTPQTIRPANYLAQLESALTRQLQWVAFEANGEALWKKVRGAMSDYLMGEWQKGLLLGTQPEQAFFVRCDQTTMTQTDLHNGRLISLVGVAPAKPAEFVIIRIELATADRKA